MSTFLLHVWYEVNIQHHSFAYGHIAIHVERENPFQMFDKAHKEDPWRRYSKEPRSGSNKSEIIVAMSSGRMRLPWT